MASKKDLVEAHSFSRRRLVTAFVSGSPGGREVEPVRPGRTIAGGAALAILLIAGAAVAGIFKAPNDTDWSRPMYVVERDQGGTYVNLPPADGGKPELRQVINITSARLLLGEDFEKVDVAREEIADRKKFGRVGILDAPVAPPAPEELVQTGWTGCADTGEVDQPLGTKVTIDTRPEVQRLPGAAFLVRARSEFWLVAESSLGADRGGPRAYAYRVPAGDGADNLLGAIAGLNLDEATAVSSQWLDLLPTGGTLSLSSFGIDDVGASVAADGFPARARIGDYLVVADTGEVVVISGTGDQPALVRLDPFAAAVYRERARGAGPAGPRDFTVDALPPDPPQRDTPGFEDNAWPQDVVPEEERGAQRDELCVQLEVAPGVQPAARLATTLDESRSAADDVEPGATAALVEPGYGAVVSEGGWEADSGRATVLVDELGRRYPIADALARTNLGYADVPPVVVPVGWTQAFATGVTLSVDAARCPPSATPLRASSRGCVR